MTSSETAKLVAMLINAFPQSQFGPQSSELYEAMLADIEIEHAMVAVQRLIATSKWLPTIAEIRSLVADIKFGPKRLGAEAWGEVSEAVRRIGSYQPPPEFSDPMIGECVRLFGWRAICGSTNEIADRARFIELYDGMQERERRDQVAGFRLTSAKTSEVLPCAPKFGLALRELPAQRKQAGGAR